MGFPCFHRGSPQIPDSHAAAAGGLGALGADLKSGSRDPLLE